MNANNMSRDQLIAKYFEFGLDRYYKNAFNPAGADLNLFRRIIQRTYERIYL
jgi:hypothetical protein